MNLLLVLTFPEGEPYLDENVDPDDLADIIVALLNEDRQRNADEAGRPDYYKPLMVCGLPGPQWLNGRGMAALMRAVELVRIAHEPLGGVPATKEEQT